MMYLNLAKKNNSELLALEAFTSEIAQLLRTAIFSSRIVRFTAECDKSMMKNTLFPVSQTA